MGGLHHGDPVRESSARWRSAGSRRGDSARGGASWSARLIVISSHGLTGIRKLFFGSTTERVLRETAVPVLVTPPHEPGLRTAGGREAAAGAHPLVPVDLSPSTRCSRCRWARVGSRKSTRPGQLILVNVVEPLRSRLATRLNLAGIEADRRAVAEEGLGRTGGDPAAAAASGGTRGLRQSGRGGREGCARSAGRP